MTLARRDCRTSLKHILKGPPLCPPKHPGCLARFPTSLPVSWLFLCVKVDKEGFFLLLLIESRAPSLLLRSPRTPPLIPPSHAGSQALTAPDRAQSRSRSGNRASTRLPASSSNHAISTRLLGYPADGAALPTPFWTNRAAATGRRPQTLPRPSHAANAGIPTRWHLPPWSRRRLPCAPSTPSPPPSMHRSCMESETCDW